MDRFEEKIFRTNRCWLWTASNNGHAKIPYGQFWMNGRLNMAHRVAYEQIFGPIPENLELDHLCRNTLCVNPDHLEPVTRAENMRRVPQRQPFKACKRGHKFTPENTRINTSGGQVCRTCERARNRRRRASVPLKGRSA